MFLGLTGSIATSVTLAITIVTSASLLVINFARYVQTKKFGIPLKMINQASLPDSLDLWVIFVGAFGFGIFLPGFVVELDINIFAAAGIAFVSCYTSFMLLGSKNSNVAFRDEERGNSINFSIQKLPAKAMLMLAISITAMHMYLRYVNRNLDIDGVFVGNIVLVILLWGVRIALWFYRGFIFVMFAVIVTAKIYGEKDFVTIDIDGQQPYLVTLRHNPSQWILMPCTLEVAEGENGVERVIKFTKGRFIIRDLSKLKEVSPVVCRSGYVLVGVADADNTSV